MVFHDFLNKESKKFKLRRKCACTSVLKKMKNDNEKYTIILPSGNKEHNIHKMQKDRNVRYSNGKEKSNSKLIIFPEANWAPDIKRNARYSNGKIFHESSQARPVIQMFNFHFYARLISLFAISTYHLVTSDRTLYTAHQKHPPPRPHVSSRIHMHPHASTKNQNLFFLPVI